MNQAHHTKHTIFWADDDPDDLDLFRELMQALAPDHNLVEFANGLALLNQLKSMHPGQFPCLVVLDLNMPLLSGKETLAKTKEDPALQNIPVAIFTTSVRAVDKSWCDNYRVEMFTKPPSIEQLRASIQKLMCLCNI